MRFIVRPGSDPVARADALLLKTLGLPYGGTVAIGDTHALIQPATVDEPTAVVIGERTRRNAGIANGDSVEVTRAVLAPATAVVLDTDASPDASSLVSTWLGRPVTAGDVIEMPDGSEITLVDVRPSPAGTISSATHIVNRSEGADLISAAAVKAAAEQRTPDPGGAKKDSTVPPSAQAEIEATTAEALLVGLNTQRELLSGWLTLLTSPDDLPSAWGLPRVAGVWVEGPPGCGRPELVHAAASDVEVKVEVVPLEKVFKPERLLDVCQGALARAGERAVLFLDRVELLSSDDALSNYRTQFAAVFRWFLDAVSERPGLAVVMGTSSVGRIDPSLAKNELLPRSLTIPPPDLNRRERLFEAALANVPVDDVDHATLAARSAGFSGTDIVGAVLGASASLARRGGRLTTDQLVEAIAETTPSLGSASLGDIPSHGFDQVANMTDVKQRLTEAVIWPITNPGRFRTLGIDPPRGILLYGPPGTGKTFVVKAVAHEAGAAFFPVKGAELLDKYVGESERAVRDLFSRARVTSPSIIFFDELDALVPVRGSSTTSVTDSVVAAMLTELDGAVERGDVAVIGATNRVDLIDPALLRSGRFETHIELGLPDVAARRALLDITDVPLDDDVNLDKLAELTEGLSFADLTGLLREAALTALRRDTTASKVSWPDLVAARQRF